MIHGNIFYQLFLSFMLALLGLVLLLRSKRLFRRLIPNNWVRRNVVTILIIECIYWAMTPIFPDFSVLLGVWGVFKTVVVNTVSVAFGSIIPYNLAVWMTEHPYFRKKSFSVHQLLILTAIIVSTILVYLPINYVQNGFTAAYFKWAVGWSFYYSSLVAIINLVINYINRERKQQESLKELELLKLNELRIKAELDALHAKINPHFLYNALNSIADLTLTDGQKARGMTLALSDLFRYSINYSGSNYCTVAEEAQMAATYLQIEKVRFEDRLVYQILVDEAAKERLMPRFLVQPLVENAVKHCLKGAVVACRIQVAFQCVNQELVIRISDSGPAFPEQLVPGYGLKNVMDKLNLLYPGHHELHFVNAPEKHLNIVLKAFVHESTLENSHC